MASDSERTDNLHRPPLGAATAAGTRPLIVTPTFVSRVDDTARGERPQDAGASKSRHGHEVHLPNRRPHALALEGNPNLAFEHWDEYWRKVHGPKFACGEPGSSSADVLRYDHVHRIASGPSSSFPPPYRAMVGDNGRLPADPEKHVPPCARPRWDGFAYIAYAELNMIGLNAVSQVHLTKRLLPDMVAQGAGKLLYTASISGTMPTPYESVYGATKAFLISFAQAVKSEVKDSGVTITLLLPGQVDTPFWHRAGMDTNKLGLGEKAAPSKVAHEGYEALKACKDRVVAGMTSSKLIGNVVNNLMPDTVKADLHAADAEPGSGLKD